MQPLLMATTKERPTGEWYKGQVPNEQFVCTKQPLNKGHLCITAQTFHQRCLLITNVSIKLKLKQFLFLYNVH